MPRHVFIQTGLPLKEHTVLLDPDLAKLVSRYYAALGTADPQLVERARARWMAIAPELSDKMWSGVLDMYLTTVIVLQIWWSNYDIYIRYIIPLYTYFVCIREILHCVINVRRVRLLLFTWYGCSKIRPLWSHATEFIADNFSLPNVCSPLVCLLGAIEDEEMDAATKLFLTLLFFYVRKLIARRWIHVENLTLGMWIKLVSADIPLYRMTYEAWGCPKKCRKVWFQWADSSDKLEGAVDAWLAMEWDREGE